MYLGHFDFAHPLLWTVPRFLSPDECAAIRARTDSAEWLPATVNSEHGRVVDARVRDNTLAVLRDPALAEDLFTRARQHVPARMSAEIGRAGRVDVEAVGVHVPLRVYRYEVGQHFGLHQDQAYFREDGARSLLTFMVYLNDDFAGGETEFPEQDRLIVPAQGTALFFQHMVLHAGKSVTRGTKLVLRSDVLYAVPRLTPAAPGSAAPSGS
jgi:predicted 2-oxoglutarate/Fe(II)-dependent dioxygenase YbiX